MPTATVNAGESIFEKSISKLLDVLRSDPAISLAGVNVLAAEGDRRDLAPNMPEESQLPAIRVGQKVNLVGRWYSEESHLFQVEVPLELIHLGTYYGDGFRLVSLLIGALWPQEESRRAAVRALFNENVELQMEQEPVVSVGAQEASPIGSDQFATSTKALLVLNVRFTT